MKKERPKQNNSKQILASSFKDPSGFIYHRNGILYRQINHSYKENYDYLIKSGLYSKLVKEGLIIPHKEVDLKHSYNGKAYKVIKPVEIPFISYPYGWSFSMIRDAALLTLSIHKIALEYGMALKDASAFNVQFLNGRPIFIDTLSFEMYKEGLPWVAYRQFCQHFLATLALMSHTDIRLNQLLKIYIDGIPLDLATKLLPKKTYLDFSILSHIHIHAKSQNMYADKQIKLDEGKIKMPKIQQIILIDNLQSTVQKLKLKKTSTEWGEYYTFTNYDKKAFNDKANIIKKFTKKIKHKTIWDMGANDGHFSRVVANKTSDVIAFDIDPVAVEKNYLKVKKYGDKNILPILLDLTNPTSDYGWSNEERKALIKRGPADIVLALALIHHLAIGNNLPFSKIAEFFAKICKYLIIEFVPKKDSQVKKLLASREDIFTEYDQENFEKSLNKYYQLISKSRISNSFRTIYLFKLK